jgi:hypothetical protein
LDFDFFNSSLVGKGLEKSGMIWWNVSRYYKFYYFCTPNSVGHIKGRSEYGRLTEWLGSPESSGQNRLRRLRPTVLQECAFDPEKRDEEL